MAHQAHPPHGHAGHGIESPGAAEAHSHAHTVVPMRVLVLVLMALLGFTFLTVLAASIEQWVSATFDVVIPQWVNVAVALSIAVVKSLLVAAFFMALRYDNPTNALVAFFTVITLAFFLGFTMIDLGNRDAVYAKKAQYIADGGTGYHAAGTTQAQRAREIASQESIDLIARDQPLPKHLAKFCVLEIERFHAQAKELPEYLRTFQARREHLGKNYHDDGHGAHGGHGALARPDHATPNAAVIRSGLTLPELGGKGHSDEHHAPADHHNPADHHTPAPGGDTPAQPAD
ncbi:MAG: hypothetical protein C0468_01210 [Planctomyces sp.]|nr:hypothetical protein [Planctomyces sp.]